MRGQLVDRRDAFAAVRSDKSRALATTRESRQHLEGDLAALERENARVQAQLAGHPERLGAHRRGPHPAGLGRPDLAGQRTGRLPFRKWWGRLHAGVDIAVPAGTPIRAAQSGRVVLLGWTGGYGNYTCVAHGGALCDVLRAPVTRTARRWARASARAR